MNRINKEGYMVVRSDKTRKAILNQADCMERIRALIHEASQKPRGLSEDEKIKIEIEYASRECQLNHIILIQLFFPLI